MAAAQGDSITFPTFLKLYSAEENSLAASPNAGLCSNNQSNYSLSKSVAVSSSESGGMKTYDMRFIRGATHLVVGPSGSGKTFRTCDIIRHKDEMIEDGDKIRNVIFCYAAWQPVYSKLMQEGVVTKWVQKKPSSDEFVKLVSEHRDSGGSICVIDDFMAGIDKDLVDIVTVQARHLNCSTFLLHQSLFPPNKEARQISLNVKYLHVHKNPRENAQIATLARQISPKGGGWIEKAYQEVTRQPYQCLLIDCTQGCHELMRFRSHYLPKEAPMRVWIEAGSFAV